jgi:hypothetical protein
MNGHARRPGQFVIRPTKIIDKPGGTLLLWAGLLALSPHTLPLRKTEGAEGTVWHAFKGIISNNNSLFTANQIQSLKELR